MRDLCVYIPAVDEKREARLCDQSLDQRSVVLYRTVCKIEPGRVLVIAAARVVQIRFNRPLLQRHGVDVDGSPDRRQVKVHLRRCLPSACPAHLKLDGSCLETYGAFGPDAQALITDIADHAEQTAPYLDFGANWAAPDIAATARCMVSVAIRIGVSQQLRAIADLKSSRPRFACPRRTQRRRGVATARVNPNVARM